MRVCVDVGTQPCVYTAGTRRRMLSICMCTQAPLCRLRCQHGSVQGTLPSPGAAIPSAALLGLIPGTLAPLPAPGLGRLGTGGKTQVRGNCPWQPAGRALRLELEPEPTARVPVCSKGSLGDAREAEESGAEPAACALDARSLAAFSSHECWPRDFAAASFPAVGGEPRSCEVNDVYQGSAPEVPARW